MRPWRGFLCLLLAALMLAPLLPASALALERAETNTAEETQTTAEDETAAGPAAADGPQTVAEAQTQTETQTTAEGETQTAEETAAEAPPEVLTMTYINPLYADVIRPEDVPQPASMPLDGASGTVCTTVDEAGAQMRQAMTERAGTIIVRYRTASFDPSAEARPLMLAIAEQALIHTGVPDEGDYISRQYGSWSAALSYISGAAGVTVTVTYTVAYYTTAAQEAAMDTAVAGVMSALALSGRSDYWKLRAVYGYVTQNVAYDEENLKDTSYLLKHTAYAALIDGKAVCQGFAALLYRLLLEAGVDCRVITGTSGGEGHDWNIAAVDGLYYDLDATWDAGKTGWQYFLRCDARFPGHTRLEEFTTSAFHAAYPMGTADCPVPAHNYLAVVTPVTHLTDGYTTYTCTCDDCGDSYVGDVVEAEGHTAATDEAVAPTCTKTGLTAGSHCSVCGDVLTAQQIVEAAGHTEVTDEAVAPTCTKTGLTTGSHCSVCGDVLTAQQVVEATGHTEVTDEAVPASCTQDGLTAGSHCSVCGDVLTAQQVVKAAGHAYIAAVTEPTVTLDGYIVYTCSVCGDSYTVAKTPALGKSARGWLSWGGGWYYFAQTGVMKTGWLKYGGVWYYLDDGDGRMLSARWLDDTYYFKASGVMATGWQQIGEDWYWFSAGGKKLTGWQRSGERWYYLGGDGKMYASRWLDDTYYLKSSGVMATGWAQDGGDWYLFSAGGKKLTGWRQSGDFWYYLGADGKMFDGAWYTGANGRTYYLKPGGKMAVGWYKIDGDWYWFSAGGIMKTSSWLKSGSYWYWLKADGKMAKSETVTVSGREQDFDAFGHWLG